MTPVLLLVYSIFSACFHIYFLHFFVLAFIIFLINFNILFKEFYDPLPFLLPEIAFIGYFEQANLYFYCNFDPVTTEHANLKGCFSCYGFSCTMETSLDPSSLEHKACSSCKAMLTKCSCAAFGYY